MLLERNGKLTMWNSKSLHLSYSLVERLPPLSMMNVRYKTGQPSGQKMLALM